jgi:Na+-translocating ferredoxin:NAD+ oxidoreductase RnfD subunit
MKNILILTVLLFGTFFSVPNLSAQERNQKGNLITGRLINTKVSKNFLDK